MSDDNFNIPPNAFWPEGVCDFCNKAGPVVECAFGLALTDGDDIIEESAEVRFLCKEHAEKAMDMDMPLEYIEAELGGEQQ